METAQGGRGGSEGGEGNKPAPPRPDRTRETLHERGGPGAEEAGALVAARTGIQEEFSVGGETDSSGDVAALGTFSLVPHISEDPGRLTSSTMEAAGSGGRATSDDAGEREMLIPPADDMPHSIGVGNSTTAASAGVREFAVDCNSFSTFDGCLLASSGNSTTAAASSPHQASALAALFSEMPAFAAPRAVANASSASATSATACGSGPSGHTVRVEDTTPGTAALASLALGGEGTRPRVRTQEVAEDGEELEFSIDGEADDVAVLDANVPALPLSEVILTTRNIEPGSGRRAASDDAVEKEMLIPPADDLPDSSCVSGCRGSCSTSTTAASAGVWEFAVDGCYCSFAAIPPNAGAHGSIPSPSQLHMEGAALKKQASLMITDNDQTNGEDKVSESESCFRNREVGKEKDVRDLESYYREREIALRLRIDQAHEQLEAEKRKRRDEILKKSQQLAEQKLLLERKQEDAWAQLQSEKLKCEQESMDKNEEMLEMENNLNRDALRQLELEKKRNREELKKKAEQFTEQKLAHDRQREECYNLCNHQLLSKDMELWKSKNEELSKQDAAMLQREADLRKEQRDTVARLREHALKLRGEAANALEADLESLKEPLLDHQLIVLKAKDDNDWNKRQLVVAMPLITGLVVMFQIQSYLPPEHRTGVMRAFTIVWVFGSLAFLSGLLGKHKLLKAYALYIGRLTFMCFAMFVIYSLYLLSSLSHTTSSQPCLPCPGSLAPSPTTPAQSDLKGDSWFYTCCAFLGLLAFFVSWAL